MDNQVSHSIRWDAHACLPLHPEASLSPLLRYREAGVHYVSVNVGMDMNPLQQVMNCLAGFRSSIRKHPHLMIAGTSKEISRAAAQGILSVGFDLEGACPLGSYPEMVSLYRDLGVRQIHLAYNRNNSAAGGCHDEERGLTPLGEAFIREMNESGIIVDCSHMSKRSSLEAIERSLSPAVFSHANPSRLVPHGRNVDDEQLHAIAAGGGVVCLNGVSVFLGEERPSVEGLIRHICYVIDLIGVEHVGIGLDTGFGEDGLDDHPPEPFDPSYWWPASAGYQQGISEVKYLPPETWRALPEALSKAGLSPREVDLVLGENMRRVLDQVERVSRQAYQ